MAQRSAHGRTPRKRIKRKAHGGKAEGTRALWYSGPPAAGRSTSGSSSRHLLANARAVFLAMVPLAPSSLATSPPTPIVCHF
eukprot:scaffold273837_cov27-Tisochrysis_lutea.AAC.1